MKLNWGTGIVIAIALFAIFIGYFFIRGLQNPSDLVTDDYYNEEVEYQQHIDNRARAKQLGNIILQPQEGKIALVFPDAFNAQSATGEIHFYKPDNAKIDSRFDLSVDSTNRQVLDVSGFPRGLWYIKIDATLGNEGYYWEESINL